MKYKVYVPHGSANNTFFESAAKHDQKITYVYVDCDVAGGFDSLVFCMEGDLNLINFIKAIGARKVGDGKWEYRG